MQCATSRGWMPILNPMGSHSKALVAFTDVVKDAKDGQE